METKKITFTIGERLAAIKLFDAFKGSITQLSAILEDVKQFTINDEEWKEAELKKTPTDDEMKAMDPEVRGKTLQSWKWNPEHLKEIEISDATVTYLKEEIKKKSDAGELSFDDISLVEMDKKL